MMAPRFRHIPVLIDQASAFCKFFEFLDGGTQETPFFRYFQGLQPPAGLPTDGTLEIPAIRDALRETAFKVIVFVTDSGTRCESPQFATLGGIRREASTEDLIEVANDWEKTLQSIAPEHFGSGPQNRNYAVWSVVGAKAYMPSAQAPFGVPAPPDDNQAPIATQTCGSEVFAPGVAFQALSQFTGGYRYPICADDYTVFFERMSQSVVTGSQIPCAFDVPTAKTGETVLPSTIQMEYLSTGSGPETFISNNLVSTTNDCDASAFTISNNRVELCPAACRKVSSDEDAQLNTLFGCELDLK